MILVFLITVVHVGWVIILDLLGLFDEVTGHKYRRSWARWNTWAMGVKVVEAQISEHNGAALYVSNHRSLTDPIIQIPYFDAFIIAKNEVSHIPVVAKGAKMTGIVFVKRESLSSRKDAKIQTANLLKGGKNILVYPEGTTTTDRTTQSFKPGTFKTSAELGLPVIPVAIEYRDKKDFWFQHGMFQQMLGQLGAWRTEVKIHVGEPLYSKDSKELMGKSKSFIDDELQRMQEGWSRVFD